MVLEVTGRAGRPQGPHVVPGWGLQGPWLTPPFLLSVSDSLIRQKMPRGPPPVAPNTSLPQACQRVSLAFTSQWLGGRHQPGPHPRRPPVVRAEDRFCGPRLALSITLSPSLGLAVLALLRT